MARPAPLSTLRSIWLRLGARLALLASVASPPFLAGQTLPLAPLKITAPRAFGSEAASVFSSQVISADELARAPGLTLDEALRENPAFSLFRRSDSLVAHPTTQGVSLRGVGPSGASRSLVLLDGVPVNDPFGGWVQWAKLPRDSMQRVEIDSGGGASAWGNGALGGVVQLLTDVPRAEGGKLDATLGDFSTRGLEWEENAVAGHAAFQLTGRVFSTDGYDVVAPESLGPIDRPASTRHQWVSGKWVQTLRPDLTATLNIRFFHETRDNGTPYQTNASRELFVSGALDARVSAAFRWNAVVYGQKDGFASTFSSVAANRASETPASNQYDVPAEAQGAAWTGTWIQPDGSETVAGADARHVRGESRELMTYSNGHYTRDRVSGGAQTIAGLFILHRQRIAESWTITPGLRLDSWRDYDGHRREHDLATGAVLRDDHPDTRHGLEWSPSLSLAWRPDSHWRLTLAGQQAFRRPTLNELYRPFRVGNIITEANPALGTERDDEIEFGAEAQYGAFSSRIDVFDNELHGSVGSVTVAHGPGNVPGFGFIPAGGLGRLRENLGLVRVRGAEASGRWQLTPHFALTAAGLANDARVVRAPEAPNLEGNRVAEVPRFSGTVGLIVSGTKWELAPQGRWIGAQFDDDENQLRLAPAWVVDLTARFAVARAADLYLSIENLFNERIETGRSATNVVNVGTPRFATGGVRLRW